jgi:hypothetical protein
MINFRFHLASLVAIFLALALGVVIDAVSSTVVWSALDNRLNRSNRSDQIEQERRAQGIGERAGRGDRALGAMPSTAGSPTPTWASSQCGASTAA